MKPIKDPTRLGRLLIVWLWAFFAVKLVLVAVMTINLLAYFAWVPEAFPYGVFGAVVKLTTRANLGVHCVAGLMSLVWIHRTSRNANLLTGGLPISSGWAVGWYFVPIGAFWKPFQALEQAWKASAAPTAWQSVATPALLRWWWAFWLAAGVVSVAFSVLHRYAIKDQAFGSIMLIAISLLVMGQCVLFARIVRRLDALQSSPVNIEVFD